MVLRLRQHNIGYTADGFYRSDDPTNSVKALKEGLTQYTYRLSRLASYGRPLSVADKKKLKQKSWWAVGLKSVPKEVYYDYI